MILSNKFPLMMVLVLCLCFLLTEASGAKAQSNYGKQPIKSGANRSIRKDVNPFMFRKRRFIPEAVLDKMENTNQAIHSENMRMLAKLIAPLRAKRTTTTTTTTSTVAQPTANRPTMDTENHDRTVDSSKGRTAMLSQRLARLEGHRVSRRSSH